jgi:hypothetical protein
MHEVTQGKLLLHSIQHIDRKVYLISVGRNIPDSSLKIVLIVL